MYILIFPLYLYIRGGTESFEPLLEYVKHQNFDNLFSLRVLLFRFIFFCARSNMKPTKELEIEEKKAKK